jgi:hypothetical protein
MSASGQHWTCRDLAPIGGNGRKPERATLAESGLAAFGGHRVEANIRDDSGAVSVGPKADAQRFRQLSGDPLGPNAFQSARDEVADNGRCFVATISKGQLCHRVHAFYLTIDDAGNLKLAR